MSKLTILFKRFIIQMLVLDKDTLFATPEHLFMSGKKWVAAAALVAGTYLQTSAGQSLIKENKLIQDTSANVYNFTVEDQHTYYVGKSQILTHNDCNFINGLLEGLETAELKSAFIATLKSNADFITLFKNGTIKIEDWLLLKNANRTGLMKNVDALKALNRAKKNSKLQELGFTDEVLASVQGYSDASFVELLDDLDNFGKNITTNSINIENIQSIRGILTGGNANYRQGVHWVIKDIKNNAADFSSKTIRFEHSITNARGTNSSIDLFCSNCVPANLKIEYKSGPGSMYNSIIKEQFIERDLFNATQLNEIQWRLTGTDMTSDKLKLWMKEYKTELNNLSLEKKNLFFPGYDNIDGISDLDIDSFVTANYSSIFRQ